MEEGGKDKDGKIEKERERKKGDKKMQSRREKTDVPNKKGRKENKGGKGKREKIK